MLRAVGTCPLAPGGGARLRGAIGLVMAIAVAVSLGCAGAYRSPATTYTASSQTAVAVEPGADAAFATPPATGRIRTDDGDSPQGVFHRVETGQTLWRIARVYGLSEQELQKVNDIDDPTQILVGQELFIPGATAVMQVPPYPSPLPLVPVPAPKSLSSAARDAGFEWPVAGGRVISYFGARRRTHRHSGIDIDGDRGQEILASRAGVVTYSGKTRTGYGKLVILDHGNGIESLYAHDQDVLVRIGDKVDKGQPIARLGRTGNATTPHCHFEIRKDRVAVDPLLYLSRLAEVRP